MIRRLSSWKPEKKVLDAKLKALQEEEERRAEAAAERKAEAEQLNLEVRRRLTERQRRISGERYEEDHPVGSDVPFKDRPGAATRRPSGESQESDESFSSQSKAQAPAPGLPRGRSERIKSISRVGMGFVEEDEVDVINQTIRSRTKAREERKSKAAVDLQQAAAQLAAEQLATREEQVIIDDSHAPIHFVPQTPAANERMTAMMSHGARADVKSKGLSARDRLAEIQRESAALKEEAYRTEDPCSVTPTFAQLGAARAAAKMAGGVFTTLAENAEMHEKLRALAERNKELEDQAAMLREMVSSGNTSKQGGSSWHGGRLFASKSPSFFRPTSAQAERHSGSSDAPSGLLGAASSAIANFMGAKSAAASSRDTTPLGRRTRTVSISDEDQGSEKVKFSTEAEA